jgi:hypothetical protein
MTDNHERPHEELGGDFPADRWQPSTKDYSGRFWKPEHSGHFEVRRLNSCGTFLLSGQYFLSNALAGEELGLEEVGDAVWNIVYYSTVPGRIALQTNRITGSQAV